MKKTTVITIVLLSLAVVFPAMAADTGAALFQTKCAMCHGKTGAGDTSIAKSKGIKDLGSSDIQKLSDEQLTDMIANGGANKTKGHEFKSKGLTDEQIKSLVAFIRTLKK